ncbi:malignant fibrous histiocytoma-amplified sequence 1 homolog, partial [Ruditapes philippinarum]|uniref:malignant fibrous histiocytoma-amplified sequence 1 homolog n=1 Tax=Ruditapes philippinarum TaxID=129788 RepID=UPI00295BDBD7
MTTTTNQGEVLRQFLTKDPKGRQSLVVPEGRYKGWVPRCLYEMNCANVCLPFLKLLSFPVGGSSLGNLVGMETFNAVGNYLTRLPDSFGKCQNLVRLNLSYNYLERIPSAIFQLSNLLELDLSENELSAIHPSIGNLKRLRTLNLSGNLLDELPAELAECEKLERLDLSRKWYPKGGFQVLPEAVCYLTELTYLDISWHQVSTITDDVKNMTKLQTLRMRGNYLKHVSPSISECRKLQYLDLTGAMKLNSYIPPEIFTLPELRILDLTNNYFTEISPDIIGLKKLKKMIMRRNALLRIPDEIFKMESLEALDLCENYLEDIPHCINELQTLKCLYLACNKIKEIPEEICECEELQEIQLHYNKLELLPDDISKLYKLEELMLEGNQLKRLPLMLDKLEKLRETGRLSLYNNNLVKPPQSICDQGVDSLYGYLKELRICEATHRKKLILIGASKAGKSSLRNVLILGKSRLTAEHERTWVMEQHLWEPEPDLRVQILDFGGHHIYSAAHHMFLTPEALHVLVFDMNTYMPGDYDLKIGDWLDSIMDRAPGASIMLVGTHADLCTKDHIKTVTDHILSRMHEEEDAKIKDLEMNLRIEQRKLTDAHKESGQKFPDLVTQRLQERVNKMQKLHITRIKLPTEIFVVSCAETLSGIINFHECLTDTLKSSEGQPLPTSWFKFLTAIQERPEKILSWSQTLEIFESIIATLKQSMYMLQGSAEKSLEMVLRYLHVTGEIVWYHDNPKLRNIVFHHPETLVEMLRAIFRHDFREVVNYVDTYGQMTGLSQVRFTSLKEEFLQRGLMTNDLLSYCLQHFNLSLESQETFMDLMLKFDLCYQVKDPTSAPGTLGSKQILQFPWFLTCTPPADFAIKWPEKVPINIIELRYQLQFLKKGLPNFFEKMSARLQSYVTQREDWKDGILASRNKCKLLLTRKKTAGLSCITLSVRGADLQDLWFLILTLRADMLALLQEWPFVKVDPYMVCAHCIATSTNPPYLWRGEILDAKCPKGLYQTHCPKTSHEIPACLIYPIDSEFPSEDINRHITTVTDFLRNNYDTVDSAGLLSDLVMSRIAAKLGFEWNQVALELGLTQANIEQIQISHKYEGAHKMILSALLKWRDNNGGT